MKFAHEFKDALEKGGFPPHWVESAIPYGQLKKCIKKVKRELEAFGLDSQTLRLLTVQKSEDEEPGSGAPIAFKYKLAGKSYDSASCSEANNSKRNLESFDPH